MNTLLSLVLVANMASAAPEAPTCHTVWVPVKVCDAPKKAPKKKVTKKPVAPKKEALAVAEPEKAVVAPEPVKEVVAEPVVVAVVEPTKAVETPEDPLVVVGLRGAVGVGVRNEYDTWGHTSALLGVRVRFPKVHLGLDAYTPFDYGTVAVQALVYPYQGEKLNWQVGVGVLSTGALALSTGDVPRTWDATLGTGIEYKLAKHVSLTVDWRGSLPSPVFMADQEQAVAGKDGRYLDVKHVLGNTLTQSQVLVGLMVHTD